VSKAGEVRIAHIVPKDDQHVRLARAQLLQRYDRRRHWLGGQLAAQPLVVVAQARVCTPELLELQLQIVQGGVSGVLRLGSAAQ